MSTRVIHKAKISVQDLLIGSGVEEQLRDGQPVSVGRINLSTFAKGVTFATGGVLNNQDDWILDEAAEGGTGLLYRWQGSFPKVVPEGVGPANTGGIGADAWHIVGYTELLNALAATTGAALVGYGENTVAETLDAIIAAQFTIAGSDNIELTQDPETGVITIDVTQAVQNVLARPAIPYYPIELVAGTSKTVSAADHGKIINFNTADACTLTLPSDAEEDLPDGFYVQFRNRQGGAITLTSSASIVGDGTVASTTAQQTHSVYKEGANLWVSVGNFA